MKVSSKHIADFSICRYLTHDDLSGSFDDLFFWMEREKIFRNSENPILLDHISYDLPSIFDRDHSFCLSLESVGCVYIFDFFQSFSILESLLEIDREEPLFADSLYGSDFCLIEILFSFLDIDDISYLILIEIASTLFAISCDKRYSRSFGRESEDSFYLEGFESECIRYKIQVVRFDHEEGIIYGRVYREIRVLRENIYTIIYKNVLTEREFCVSYTVYYNLTSPSMSDRVHATEQAVNISSADPILLDVKAVLRRITTRIGREDMVTELEVYQAGIWVNQMNALL